MARQELSQFYQKIRAELPQFTTEVVSGETVCTLRMPAVMTREGTFDAQIFTGTGRNKKLATAQAAEAGWEFLKQQAVFARSQPSSNLWEVLAKLMTPQGLKKEPEFEGYVALAQRFNDGWLPVQQLAQARPILQWARQQAPEALISPEEFLTAIQGRLASEKMTPSAMAAVEKDAGSRNIRRLEEYFGRQNSDVLGALHATIDHGDGRRFNCVSIPADSSLAIGEAEIAGGGSFWETIAGTLGCNPDDLLYWDKIGRTKSVFLPEGGAAEIDDPELEELLEGYLGPKPTTKEKSGSEKTAREANGAMHTGGESASDAETARATISSIPLVEVRQPVLYSQARSPRLNQRASWLLGRPVRGDCLVSYCRLRPCEWRTPSVKWASLPLAVFWPWVGACMPSAEYASTTPTPLLARLPHTYRTAKGWFGSSPVDLLGTHVPSGIRTGEAVFRCRPMSDDPGCAWECSASIGLLGEEAWLSAEACECATEDAARQQAALTMLHDYERRFTSLLLSGAYRAEASVDSDLCQLRVDRQSDAAVPKTGAIVHFSARVVGDEGPFAGETLASCAGRFEWGSQAVAPALEAVVEACRPGGAASCSLALPIGVPNLLARNDLQCRLEVRPEQRVKFVAAPGQAQQDDPIFVPAMSTQRHEHMEQLLRQHGASTVLDIGCGDGRLIEHLALKASRGAIGVRKVVGMDIDGMASARGGRRICTRHPGIFEGPSAPELELYQADSACEAASTSEAWGSYVGVDAAIFQEVIEHLDPAPLEWLGRCLLGALQPRLLLLSTPNFEYNAVLHHLRAQLLPNGLRNSGHRFEWTRKEFQSWCEGQAQEFGYSVTFQGLGRAVDEGKALEDPATPLHGRDVGESTQVAVFERLAGQPSSAAFRSLQATSVFDSKTFLAEGQLLPTAPKPRARKDGSENFAEALSNGSHPAQQAKRPRC